MEPTPGADLFDDIAAFKADAAERLQFDVADRVAATSPGPAILRTLADAIPSRPSTTIVDLGAGLGGASTWLATYTRAHVIAVEPCDGARAAAHRLFPDLDVRAGTAQQSGLEDDVADAVVIVGVASLLADLSPALAEARRLLRPGGVLGIADMFLDPAVVDTEVEHAGINVLRSLAATATMVAAAGFEVTDEDDAVEGKPDGWWGERADELTERILRDHSDDPSVQAWLADQAQLAAWFGDAHVHNGCLIARAPAGG